MPRYMLVLCHTLRHTRRSYLHGCTKVFADVRQNSVQACAFYMLMQPDCGQPTSAGSMRDIDKILQHLVPLALAQLAAFYSMADASDTHFTACITAACNANGLQQHTSM